MRFHVRFETLPRIQNGVSRKQQHEPQTAEQQELLGMSSINKDWLFYVTYDARRIFVLWLKAAVCGLILPGPNPGFENFLWQKRLTGGGGSRPSL